WERRFGFPKPQRSPGKHRLFTHGEVAALRDALQEGLSISSAISRAREGLVADTNSLLGALVSYERDRADNAIEAALALRSVERSVEEVLLPTLDEISRRYGTESAAWAFAAQRGSRRRRCVRSRSWLATRRAMSSTPTRRTCAHLSSSASERESRCSASRPEELPASATRSRSTARTSSSWRVAISTTTRSRAGLTRSGWRSVRRRWRCIDAALSGRASARLRQMSCPPVPRKRSGGCSS